ncbi:hypothetical protein [Rickettsia endosymbiont of Gonocerus acuteangulatus]|uniref:hypothetical protein n=1 Tax=Rickettsia endosymbiont of Gonocerus acuteangulatus TaxID=3066266 RepID=UPI003132B08B
MHFQHIITTLRKFDPNFNESEINSAITFSLKCSNNNISWEIAEIITSIYPDSNSVIAALRFFITENNNLKSIKIEYSFSKEIFDIFYALTKLFKIHNIHSDVTSQKTIRLLSSLDSNIKIKVLLIRFAYLLHKIIFNSNISHIEYVWISKEISKIYVPLFKEIKVEKIKVALQNACFKNLQPRLYKTIISFLDREYLHYELVAQIINALHNILPATNIEYTISGRIKSPYSIAKKIVHKSSTIQQLYDIIGIRIIVEKEQECYDILGTIHKHYVYIPERYKNLIKFPRKNGYQSLHTVIISKDLRKVEVQIRTKIMHYIAEYGTASHSQYKMGLINISNIAYNILNRLILDILNQLTIIPILHTRINNSDTVYVQLLTNEVSGNVLTQQLLNINLENKTFVNDKVLGIIDEWNDNLPLHYAATSRQSRVSTPMNAIFIHPLKSLDLDIEQESNNANDSGIVESNFDEEDYTTFNPRQSRVSTPVNAIFIHPLEPLDLDIEQESNNANDSGIVESNFDEEDYTTFNPRQSRVSTPVNAIFIHPLEPLDLDIEQESNNANDSGIVESNFDEEDYTTFNPRQSRVSTPVNAIFIHPLEPLDLDIEQESNNANDSGIVESNFDEEDYTTFNPRQSRVSTPVNAIFIHPLEPLDLDIEQESNNANDSGIVESNFDEEDYTTFNPRQSRVSTPVNAIFIHPLEPLDLDIEQESNNANDSGIVESNFDEEDYTTFNPRQSRVSTPVNAIFIHPLEPLDLDIEQESNNANDSGIVESNFDEEDLIHHFQSNDYQDNQDAQYVVSLLGNDL